MQENMAAKTQRIELTEDFINLWKEEKSLWDVISPLYRDRDAKHKSLLSLAEQLSMSGMYSWRCLLIFQS